MFNNKFTLIILLIKTFSPNDIDFIMSDKSLSLLYDLMPLLSEFIEGKRFEKIEPIKIDLPLIHIILKPKYIDIIHIDMRNNPSRQPVKYIDEDRFEFCYPLLETQLKAFVEIEKSIFKKVGNVEFEIEDLAICTETHILREKGSLELSKFEVNFKNIKFKCDNVWI